MEHKYIKRVKRNDRFALYVITVGGLAVIFSVILILFLVARVTFPLFQQPSLRQVAQFDLANPAGSSVLATGVDEYLENLFLVREDGTFVFYDPRNGQLVERLAADPPADGLRVVDAEQFGEARYNLLWSDGSLTMEQVHFQARFDAEGRRSFERRLVRLASLGPLAEGLPQRTLARGSTEGGLVRVALQADQRLRVDQQLVSEDLFGDRTREQYDFYLNAAPGEKITALTMDEQGTALYAGTDQGSLLRWDLSEPGEGEIITARMRKAEPGTASTEEAAPETTLTREAEIEAALPKRLQEIFKNHQTWQHTDGREGSMANLKGEKLQGTRLNGLNLMWANLSEADLSGSDLSDSDLFGADLSHAILKSTLLDWAVLIKAKLIQAKLQESSLRGANLSEADLSGADLTGANLTDAKVSDSQLELAITDNKTILPNGSQGPARKNRKD